MITEENWNYNSLISILKELNSVKIVGDDSKHILVEVLSVEAYYELFPSYTVCWCFREKSLSTSRGFFNTYARVNKVRKQYILFDLSKPFTIFSKLSESDLSCITFTVDKNLKTYKEPNLKNDYQVLFAFSRCGVNIAIPSSDLYSTFVYIINSLL